MQRRFTLQALTAAVALASAGLPAFAQSKDTIKVVAFVFGYFAFRSRIKGVYFSIITQALTFAAFLVNGAKSWLTVAAPEFWLYFLGALFLAVTLFLPNGVVGLVKKLAGRKAWRPT